MFVAILIIKKIIIINLWSWLSRILFEQKDGQSRIVENEDYLLWKSEFQVSLHDDLLLN